MSQKNILAIDIGGSKLLTAVVTLDYQNGKRCGTLHGIEKKSLTKDAGKQGVLQAIEELIPRSMERSSVSFDEIEAIGATIPGLADPQRGYWLFAPFSGIRDFPIAELLNKKYNRPVFAENDVNACAWAEKIFGVCQDVDDFLWITISNGIGGGLVLNSKIFCGAFHGAAEMGHLHMVDDGAHCGCGNRGCLEVEAAGPAIARRYREKFPDSQRPAATFDALAIAEATRNGDQIAREVFEEVGELLGRAVALAANIVNPAKIVFGGGVSGAFDLFSPKMEEIFRSQVIRAVNSQVQLVKTGLGYEAGLFAAAALAFPE